MLSQEEINALLGGLNEASGDSDDKEESSDSISLTDSQIDILGEVGNINMGTAATTLSSLLGERVSITTPNVQILDWKEISTKYNRPCVGVMIDYTKGIKGHNVLVLENKDVKIMTDLMMGGDGETNGDEKLTELDLSAIGEAMNQMIGTASTSLASLTNTVIDIATPRAYEMDFSDDEFLMDPNINPEEKMVAIFFDMQVGKLIDSNIMQIMPKEFALSLVESLQVNISGYNVSEEEPDVKEEAVKEEIVEEPKVEKEIINEKPQEPQERYKPEPRRNPEPVVNARPAQFQSFDQPKITIQKENINLLMDVPLEITVELGKTKKTVEEVLEFSPGSVIELDKLAGEPIDILVNGQNIARGEVVVIEENFAIRITSIVDKNLRI